MDVNIFVFAILLFFALLGFSFSIFWIGLEINNSRERKIAKINTEREFERRLIALEDSHKLKAHFDRVFHEHSVISQQLEELRSKDEVKSCPKKKK